MNKDRQIVSELRYFFTESGCGLGVQRIMNVLGTINITGKQIAFEKKANCKFTCAQVIQMMILFPFFSIKNVANYVGNSLQPLFDCHKDMFYRVLSNDRIDWRHILRYVNKKLVNNIAVRSDAGDSEYPTCMVVDDTDMPKTGRKGVESIEVDLSAGIAKVSGSADPAEVISAVKSCGYEISLL